MSVNFELVSPERLVMQKTAYMVVVPGSGGDFGVLAQHQPTISTLRPGVVEIFEQENGPSEKIFVLGGFVEVTGTGLTVFAEKATPLNQVNKAELAQQIQDLTEDVRDAKSDLARDTAQETLDGLKALQDSLA